MIDPTRTPPYSVWLLILLHVMLSVGALAGGIALILAPDGSLLGMPLYIIESSPFADFLIPGVILFTVLGIYPLAVACCLWKRPSWRWPDAANPFKRHHWAWAASLSVGVILLIWITVQVQYTGVDFLHYLYWAWGIVIMVVTLLPGPRRYFSAS